MHEGILEVNTCFIISALLLVFAVVLLLGLTIAIIVVGLFIVDLLEGLCSYCKYEYKR